MAFRRDRVIVFVSPFNTAAQYSKVINLSTTQFRPAYHDMELTRRTYGPHDQWELSMEVDSLAQALDDDGLDSIDLVAYSGGAAATLAFSAAYPERIRTLALAEPPWIGNDDWGPEQLSFRLDFDAAMVLPDAEVISAFQALMLAPGTPLPPIRPTPKEVELAAVAGLRTAWSGYCRAPLDRGRLQRVTAPVLLLVGSGSRERFRAAANVLARSFPSARTEVLDHCHHFDLLLAGASQAAASLDRLWGTSVEIG